jgi:hypothetical protein
MRAPNSLNHATHAVEFEQGTSARTGKVEAKNLRVIN